VDKTWENFKVHFAASHRQHNQIQGVSSTNAGYHTSNAAVGQTEEHMAEAIIGASSNLVTATATDRGVVAILTEANSRLAKQLENRSKKLKDIKTILKNERAERKGQITLTLPKKIIVGLMGTRWTIAIQASATIIPSMVTSAKPLRQTTRGGGC
jgi:ribosome-associated translation inhibitor RaiA